MAGRYPFLLALLSLVLSVTGCSELGVFNAVIPKDGGVAVAAEGVSYGPDPRQKLDIYTPSAAANAKGVIVFCYGGSWNSGDRSDYAFVGRAFASRGYVTVVFDYRLVPDIRYPGFVQDAAAATAWVKRHIAVYGGNPDRLFLAGHSAGAYNMMMVALAPEFLGAEGFSPSILSGVAGLSGPYDFLPLDADATLEAFKGVRDLELTQPVNRASTARPAPPVLLLHGEADELVFIRNSKALARALRKAGHAVEEIYYPGSDHVETLLAISRPLRDRAPVINDVVVFFDRH